MPLPLEKIRAVKIIVAHDYCPDGVAGALLLKNVLPDAKVIFCQYSTPEHAALVAEPDMLFVDFSPPKDRVQEFVGAGAMVLDHHKAAKDVVRAFGELGVFADEKEEPGVSGASLAFREVWSRLTTEKPRDSFYQWVERFARLAGIRDTWQKMNPNWEQACVQSYALHFAPQETWLKIGLFNMWMKWHRYDWVGTISAQKHLRAVERVVEKGMWHTNARGTIMCVFQGTKLSSDAAEASGAEKADLICGFDVVYEGGKAKYLYSTRSRKSFNCMALAQTYGGGGHLRAAGFNIVEPKGDPYSVFIGSVEMFESTNLK